MQTQSLHFQTEYTFTISSEAELMNFFRPKDQRKVVLPSGLRYPFNVRSYFTWKESSGVYTYLVFKKPNWDMPRAMAFKRADRGSEPATGRICGWCHAYGSQEEIGMLSMSMNSEVSSGYILCNDLRCIEKIEEEAARSGKHPEKWIHQLYQKIGAFFEGISNYRPD